MANVSDVSMDFSLQHRDMRPCFDLMGGTQAMRRAGERYIAKGQQTDSEYADRLSRTVLLNVYRRTLNFMRGQVFQSPVTVGSTADEMTDEQTEQFKVWSEDVDLRGHNLTSWSANVFRQGLQDGVTFAVVDFSAVEMRVNENGATEYRDSQGQWKPKTQAADQLEGWRPYLVHVKAEQVLDMWGDFEGSAPVLAHFRYMENIQVQKDAWSKETVQQIRVYRKEAGAVNWEVWRNSSDGAKDFVLQQSGSLSIDEIPVAVFMAGDHRTEYTAEPALIDLANLNIRHWQVSSGHAEMMEFIQRPVWFAAGIKIRDEEGQPIFGAGNILYSEYENARLSSVGIDSSSYTSSRSELKALEDSMAMYGLQLLQPKTGAITATESQRDTEENNSTLRNWALDFQDFLENITRLVGKWWGFEDGCTVNVNTDFSRTVDLAFLLEMQRAGILSGDAVLNAAKNSGMLPDDFDVEEDAAKAARALMTQGTGATGANLVDVLNNI